MKGFDGMMLLKRAAALLLAFCTLLFAACGKSAEKPVLRIGVMYSSDIIPLALAKDRGLDEKNGFSLDMRVFSAARDRDAALQAGELDGIFTDFIGVCIYHQAGIDVKITGMTDGDYLLLAGKNSGIQTLEEAAGASIAISENTLIEYALDAILTANGYRPDYLKKEIVPRIPDRLELLRAGKIPLCLLPEPFSTMAQNDGAVTLGSANGIGLYPAVSAFSGEALARPQTITAFYHAYDEAADLLNSSPVSSFEDVIIQGAGFPEALAGGISLPYFRKSALPAAEEVQKAIDWSAAKGLCDPTLSPADLLAGMG